MTTYLYLVEKVVARIRPTQFFVLRFQCSESQRQSPDSVPVEGGFLPLTGLPTHWKPRSQEIWRTRIAPITEQRLCVLDTPHPQHESCWYCGHFDGF